MSNRQEWEKTEEESPAAYNAFSLYRDAGTARSVDAAFNQMRQKRGKSAAHRADGTWWQWAAVHDWKRRALAYDAHIERLAREADEAAHVADLVAYRVRARKAATDTAEIATSLLLKTGQRLQALDAKDIEPGMIPAFLRAAAAVMESSLNLEAEAIGVRRLESLLDAADSETKQATANTSM